ncbi:PREDICTED: uncharacterized protein LOC107354238 [Acropora digitifera]|uniref:uncharacterized protein LOC107354238 n=1 Tax=Acropora digitifera TaxID=70779 RepID=UPI000779FF08|nr:PREDICTED: uncharacterized protein LOC107354238 [Acropora digitifera]
MATEDPASKFLAVIQNTTKPLEGLKVLLYQLFAADEVRQSSLKGRTTVAGGESVGLQREKLELIYCVMLKKYGTERAAVGNFIRRQQRKLREQLKKKTAAAAAKSALANYNYF